MTFLPIVDRELRVSARKPVTFWLRIVVALIALLIGIGCVIMHEVSFRGGGASLGSVLFAILSWLSLAATLSAGLFLTSDCLSEEIREGTLGLLFLTDLRGYDVVAGKLLGTSLRAAYALLAIFPILAITLLMGGVAGAQFWKASLALLNALFFSLAAGLFVSARSRDAQRAMIGLLFLLLLFTFGGPVADAISAKVHRHGFSPFWCLSSPAYPFAIADSWGRTAYWASLLLTHAIGWLFFGAACLLVTRTWQDRDRKEAAAIGSSLQSIRHGSRQHRERLRLKLMDRDVITWLVCRERWQLRGLWLVTILTVCGFIALWLAMPREAWMAWQYISWFFLLLFYLWAASQGGRFFVQARHSGLLELLLVSPVSDRQVIHGQWRAILRQFGLPIIILTVLAGTGAWLSQVAWQRIFSMMPAITATTSASGGTNSATSSNIAVSGTVIIPIGGGTVVSNSSSGPATAAPGWNPAYLAPSLAAATLAAATVIANFLALFWFGMWMGMTSRTANTATAKTILFVHVIPWLGISFASSFVVGILMMGSALKSGSTPSPRFLTWYPLLSVLCTGALTVAKDIGFIIFARRTLYSRLRTQAARGENVKWAPVTPIQPPVLAPSIPSEPAT